MGCFNMICRATGAPIVHGDKVVQFMVGCFEHPNHNLSNQLNKKYGIFSLPQFGTYNDYGTIEDETTPARWQEINSYLDEQAVELGYMKPEEPNRSRDIENIMLMHEDAFDLMMGYRNWDEVKYPLEDYTYGERRQQEKQKAIESLQVRFDEYKEKMGNDVSDNMIQDVLLDTWRTSLLYDMYRMSNRDQYVWNRVIARYGDEAGELYVKYVAHMRDRANIMHWEIAPSQYGSQHVDDPEGMITLNVLANEHILRINRMYEE